MRIILKTANGDMFWFSATLSITPSNSSTVTKYPVEDGTSVSDFIYQNNPAISFTGVISDVDLGNQVPIITPDMVKTIGSNNGSFVNVEDSALNLSTTGGNALSQEAVTITSSNRNPLMNLAPDVAQAFMPADTIPIVSVDQTALMKSSEWTKAFLEAIWSNSTQVSVFEVSNGKIISSYLDYYITHLSFPKSFQTGTALQPSIRLEHVRFASLSALTNVPPLVRAMLPVPKGDATAAAGSGVMNGSGTASTAKTANGVVAPTPDVSMLKVGIRTIGYLLRN